MGGISGSFAVVALLSFLSRYYHARDPLYGTTSALPALVRASHDLAPARSDQRSAAPA